jgi:hypothetical protein
MIWGKMLSCRQTLKGENTNFYKFHYDCTIRVVSKYLTKTSGRASQFRDDEVHLSSRRLSEINNNESNRRWTCVRWLVVCIVLKCSHISRVRVGVSFSHINNTFTNSTRIRPHGTSQTSECCLVVFGYYLIQSLPIKCLFDGDYPQKSLVNNQTLEPSVRTYSEETIPDHDSSFIQSRDFGLVDDTSSVP